jgi:hypothetical protein
MGASTLKATTRNVEAGADQQRESRARDPDRQAADHDPPD